MSRSAASCCCQHLATTKCMCSRLDRICHLPSHFRRYLTELLSEFVGLAIRVNSGTAERFFFYEIWQRVLRIFFVGVFKFDLKSRLSNGHYMKTGIHFRMYIEQVKYLSDGKICSTKVVEKIKYTFRDKKKFFFFAYNSYGSRDEVLHCAHNFRCFLNARKCRKYPIMDNYQKESVSIYKVTETLSTVITNGIHYLVANSQCFDLKGCH